MKNEKGKYGNQHQLGLKRSAFRMPSLIPTVEEL